MMTFAFIQNLLQFMLKCDDHLKKSLARLNQGINLSSIVDKCILNCKIPLLIFNFNQLNEESVFISI